MPDGFFTKLAAIVLKEKNKATLAKLLREKCEEHYHPSVAAKTILPGKDGEEDCIIPANIVYAEADEHYCKIFELRNDGLEMHYKLMSLKKFLEKYGCENFMLVHKSYIVNINHIQQFINDGAKVRLTSGTEIDCNRESFNLLKHLFGE